MKNNPTELDKVYFDELSVKKVYIFFFYLLVIIMVSHNSSKGKKNSLMSKLMEPSVVTVLLVVTLVGGLMYYMGYFPKMQKKNEAVEGYASNVGAPFEHFNLRNTLNNVMQNAVSVVSRNEEDEEEVEQFSPNVEHMETADSAPAPAEETAPVQDVLGADDLLPKDVNAAWADLNPEGQGSLKAKNFLEAGYHLGINTTGQSLRNANLQLRSEPPNPQVPVSPWLQSTIEPDLNRRPLDIGY